MSKSDNKKTRKRKNLLEGFSKELKTFRYSNKQKQSRTIIAVFSKCQKKHPIYRPIRLSVKMRMSKSLPVQNKRKR